MLQISFILILWFSSIFLAVSTLGLVDNIFFLPPNLSLDLAALSPALVLSWINLFLNWLSEENILNTNSPDAVVVSIRTSHRDLKAIPLF